MFLKFMSSPSGVHSHKCEEWMPIKSAKDWSAICPAGHFPSNRLKVRVHKLYELFTADWTRVKLFEVALRIQAPMSEGRVPQRDWLSSCLMNMLISHRVNRWVDDNFIWIMNMQMNSHGECDLEDDRTMQDVEGNYNSHNILHILYILHILWLLYYM